MYFDLGRLRMSCKAPCEDFVMHVFLLAFLPAGNMWTIPWHSPETCVCVFVCVCLCVCVYVCVYVCECVCVAYDLVIMCVSNCQVLAHRLAKDKHLKLCVPHTMFYV